MSLAVDIGALTVKVASDQEVTTIPAPSGGPRRGIRAALAAQSQRGGFCVAVPDAWLAGDVAGAGRQEDVRYECEDVAGTGPVVWTGQLAAVAALTAGQHGRGRYLVCDLGGSGVRAGMFDVSDGTVQIVSTHTADGGGWADFDAAIRSAVTGTGLPVTWYEQAAGQELRASMVLEDAAMSPGEFADTRVYRISGPGGNIDLTASQVTGCFAPTLQRLRAAIGAVTGAGLPESVVLTGGLSWLPLGVRVVADAVGITPQRSGPDAPARGALLFACGEFRLAPPVERQAVTLTAHRIHDGLLEEVSVILPWTAPFATVPGGALAIDRDELELTVDGRSHTVRLSGLGPGPHRIGVSACLFPLADLTAR
jgi:hypothetical protein